MLENEARTIFRVRYPQLKQFLLRFRGSDKSDLDILSKSVPDDLKRVGVFFNLLQINDSVTLTSRGREMLLAYENKQDDRERNLLKTTFEKDGGLRLHWALICDKRDVFTTTELIEAFRNMGYSRLTESSLRQYVRAFVNWAEFAGLCVRAGIKGHTYKILERVVIGSSIGGAKNEQQTINTTEEMIPEIGTHLSLLKLNSYICDYLADQTHEGDLDLIKNEIEKLRGNDLIDDLVIDMLEREIKTALETKSIAVFATVAQSLRSLRNRYIEEG